MESNYKKVEKCICEINLTEISPFIQKNLIKKNGSIMGQCYLLEVGGTKILLDCGTGSMVGLLNQRVDLKDIDILAISSLKPKSFGDVFSFLVTRRKSSSFPRRFSKLVRVFGAEKIESTLEMLKVMSFGQDNTNNLAAKNLFGEMKYEFPDKNIEMKSFLLKKKKEFGFIIKSYGKKIVYLSNFEFDDIKIHEKIKNSDVLILANRPSKENFYQLKDLKINLKIGKIFTSGCNCPEVYYKYGVLSILEENEPTKLGCFVDDPADDIIAQKKKLFFNDGMFINVNLKQLDFFSGKDFYKIPIRMEKNKISSLYGKKIKLAGVSNKFKRRFVGMHESIEDSKLIIREIISEKFINLECLVLPIRFVDLNYLISNNLLDTWKETGFFMRDEFNNIHFMRIYRAPGEWTLVDEAPDKILNDMFIISSIK